MKLLLSEKRLINLIWKQKNKLESFFEMVIAPIVIQKRYAFEFVSKSQHLIMLPVVNLLYLQKRANKNVHVTFICYKRLPALS